MLLGRGNFRRLHLRWALFVAVLTIAATAIWLWEWTRIGEFPAPGSLLGLAMGTVAGLVILFEAALVLRRMRWFRTARWLGGARLWMKAHIWLGLFCVPIAFFHMGLDFGGRMTSILAWVFLVVIGSGVLGLVIQNILPRYMLENLSADTVFSQIQVLSEQYAADAQRIVYQTCGPQSETILVSPATVKKTKQPVYVGATRKVGAMVKLDPHPGRRRTEMVDAPAIPRAVDEHIRPYLKTGGAPERKLGTVRKNRAYFEDLRKRVPEAARDAVDRLADLCERRRQLSVQRRLHLVMHSWLWIHTPLSMALVVLLLAHVYFALRYY